MKQSQKTFALWALIILLSVTIFHYMGNRPSLQKTITFSEFLDAISKNQVEKVMIRDEEYLGNFKKDYQEGAAFETVGPAESERALELLAQSDAVLEYKRRRETPLWQQILISWLPMILLFGFFFFSMRQIQVGGGRALSFGRSRARRLSESQKKVTFKDVAGVDEAKYELEEIIQFLKEPKKFTKLGGRIPKGVLLVGAPGTGKTLLAKAVAGEAGAPFFSISGSDFVEMFVGVGASRVRDLFEQGKKNAPCIIFIDEIDAVGRHRGAGLGGGHDEREQTLNQLLVEMDGFESNEGVIIMAATNRPDVLDPALLRPGRFDRRVVVNRPDLKGREEILKVHARRTVLASEVELSVVARGTPGFSGADLENLVNEAALNAARYDKPSVEKIDFELAKDKVLMGLERKSMILSEEEKRQIAYHESGHALIAKLLPGSDPVHKVTIIPRGMALGVTQQLPIDERHIHSKTYAENRIAVLMGGRCAEELIFKEQTTGAGDDIEKATALARKMVCEWGMSELGPLSFGQKEQEIFLGRDFAQHQEYSENTAIRIDEQVSSLVNRNYEKTKKILEENRATLDRLAKALLEWESLDGDQIDRLIRSEDLGPVVHKTTPPPQKPSKMPEEARPEIPPVSVFPGFSKA
ncbi:MAG: ATP-dependent metallopeptidase FtsH/Yme1/Tma family protein [Deltaproteobacteria bacterium]|nr:ATP-dependent metallopeptidase FtsH/Yme1/Tma family protein [Deltaproteobacteria bacterium]